MFGTSTRKQASTSQDPYRGAQPDLIFRGSGFLSIVGAVTSLTLMLFYPPTAAIGAAGWALAAPTSILSIVLGVLSVTDRHRPSITSVHVSSFIGIVQIALVEWLAGGGKAPYVQLLMLPMLGSGVGQPVWRCAQVAIVASAAALSPLLYGGIDALATVTEFSLLSVMTVMTAIVISSTRAHRARLEDAGEYANVLAHIDPLTSLPNRRAFDEALVHALESSKLDGTPFSLLLCDVNSFKQINDTFGHTAGDQVLRSIAHALGDAVRRPDAGFRWGGDEFAVILRDTDEVGASRVCTRIREAVARQCRRPDGSAVTIGTGVAALNPGMSMDEVLIEADRALFSQKERRSHLRGAA
jgi:diguanylate cyclase (GGDEF)-like protein